MLSPTQHALRRLRSNERSLRGRQFAREYTAAVDEFIRELFADAVRRLSRRTASGIALIAVGSYGRRELAPSSDLDLVLIHDRVNAIGKVADALWYPIWDAGLELDHSVRTPGETLAVARGDLKAAMGLLDARCVAGDGDLAAHVAERIRRQWAAHPWQTLDRLRHALEERWAQHGELAFLLEPDIKRSRGGLRDVESLHAAVAAAPSVEFATGDPRLAPAVEELLAVRVALHTATKRRTDRLTVDAQDAVARELGYGCSGNLLQRAAIAARRVAWLTDRAWQRIDAGLTRPRSRGRDGTIEPGIALDNEELVCEGPLGADGALPLRIAAVAARTGLPLASRTLDRLEAEAAPPPEPWPLVTLDALLDLLGCGDASVGLFETLDQIGVLERYLPEWTNLRNRPQPSAYHRYTVDRHLIECAAQAAELARTVHRPDLLLVAAWLHGIGDDHPLIFRRMGFDDADVASLHRIVVNRTLLADSATRRDLDDPATVDWVAERTRSAEELDLLAALTRADAIATGPAAWSAWKERLVSELVELTRAHLAGERRDPVPSAPTEHQRRLASSHELRVVVEESLVTVVAPDTHGLLALIAGVLALNRLPVRSATAMNVDDMALDTFDVDLTGREPPDVNALHADLTKYLADPQSLQRRLLQRATSNRLPRRPGAAHLAEPYVLIINDATPKATIVEVRAPDGFGVLSRIGHAIAACGCDIDFARALTLGHEIVDTFYVVDASTRGRIFDPKRIEALTSAITAAL